MKTALIRTACSIALALLALLGASCDDIEDDVVEVGLLQVYPVHPAQTVPTLGVETIQLSRWEFTDSSVLIDGLTYDVTPGEGCSFLQSYISATTGSGGCILGAAVAVTSAAKAGVLDFTATMEISRLKEEDVSEGGDLDADGVLNEIDNCPLIGNPDQEAVTDNFGDEIGLACAIDTNTNPEADPVYFLDSEMDGQPDISDFCPFLYHPEGELPDVLPFPEYCTESATVSVAGATPFQLQVDVDPYIQERQRMLLTLDFGQNLSGLACDWTAGTCTLAPESVRACVHSSTFAASLGCL